MLISLDRSTGTIKLTHEWRPPKSILLESAKRGELFGRAAALAEWLGIAEECTIEMEERKGTELIGVLPSTVRCGKCGGPDVPRHHPSCPKSDDEDA